MTAIAGYWSLDHRPDAAAQCERMLKSQQIYGPQPPAMASDGAIALGQRLFGLTAEDRRRQSVAAGGGGTTLLVADARLDNREELCDSLGIPAGEGRALADPAIMLRALERWDEAAVERLQGDFAFAFWDSRRQRLLLARDFMGQRPLHYARRDRFFAFATMPKGLHALPEIPPVPDEEAVAGFLALLPEDGSETFFLGIEKVLAGEIVTVTRDGLTATRWWRPSLPPLLLKRPDDYADALREHLDRAVAVRLRGSGPAVAAHLSGGLDSSAVAATAARLMAEEGGRVAAFTGAPREGYDSSEVRNAFADETPYAAEVAAMYPNMDHVIVRNGGSPFADLDRYFFVYERPVLNLCNAVWMHRIMDVAREQGQRVLLTGARGNMSFSYDGMPLLSQLLSKGRLARLARESWALVRNGTRVGTVAAQTLGPFLPVPVWQAIGRMRGKGRKVTDYTAISPEAVERFRIAERAAERGLDVSYRPRRDPVETRLWVLRRVDAGNYHKGHLAGWGIDVRDPTSDRRLVEFCLTVPPDQYLRGGIRRALARTAFADRLPASVVNETRKGYQAADWHEGLVAAKDELGGELGRIEACGQAGSTVNPAMMRSLAENMPTGGWHKPAATEKYRLALLRGVSAGHFIRKAAGSNS
ncbi:MAG TPA: asparagine synthase-related protein [Allosphingosinicella sp.]|jgi:asparagine synthase (glutamine-hydrolysing)|nr:asparagine synthase-related protein [Allosphingosinicella sp.]